LIAISSLSFLGDVKIAIITQALSFIGILALGLLTPPFAIMLIFLFINSLGMHMYMPLTDSIGMSLVEDDRLLGKRMGQYKSVGTTFSLIGSIFAFIGFKTGFFSFNTQIKWVFVASAILFALVFVLYIALHKTMEHEPVQKRKFKLELKKDYKYYYILATMNGAQKQIMIVFGPWVLIEILGKSTDTMILLIMIGSFLGIFFLRLLGKWIDKFGVKKLLFADALSFIGVYVLYGLLSMGFDTGALPIVGIPFILASALFVLDRISMQMGMVRVIYLKNIAHSPNDITTTLSTGISIDHVVSIIGATLGGLAWKAWGPQYVFFIAAALSVVNLIVAAKVKLPKSSPETAPEAHQI
jgi:MFS family permease